MAPKDDRVELLKALAVTAELTGTELSEGAARVMAADLEEYPLPAVLAALTRCRRELKSKLTIAAVMERMDDGRPGADEAWAMIPPEEEGSCVWTEEMADAYGVAWRLQRDGDKVGARMAFRDAYTRMVAEARVRRIPVKWTPSLGTNPALREIALEDAVRKGRITDKHAAALAPSLKVPDNVLALPSKREPMPEHLRQQLAQTLARLTAPK
jgi:hypothetical protein